MLTYVEVIILLFIDYFIVIFLEPLYAQVLRCWGYIYSLIYLRYRCYDLIMK